MMVTAGVGESMNGSCLVSLLAGLLASLRPIALRPLKTEVETHSSYSCHFAASSLGTIKLAISTLALVTVASGSTMQQKV